jgi:membrane protein
LSGLTEIVHWGRTLLVRTRDHHVVDLAAKIAYYSFVSLFPLILIFFALTGFLGGEAMFAWTMEHLKSIMPRDAAEYVGSFVYDVTSVRRPDVLSFSIVFLFFSASGAVIALIESLNVIFDISESRPYWRKYALGVSTIVFGTLFYLVGVPVVLAGPRLLELLGMGWMWSRLHWMLVFGLLTSLVWSAYIRLPNYRRRPPLLVLLVGALVGTGLWALATQMLQLYIANFERFASLYGVVTGLLVTLMWLHVSAFALLFGAQVAAVLDLRVRQRRGQ